MADAPRYGSPHKARRELHTLTVDLPREVESVSPVAGDRPPLVVYGPVTKGQPYHEADTQLPHAHDINGTTVQFHFDPPIEEGGYRVVAYIDRFKAADGEPFDIFDETQGVPWTGWELQILESTPRYGPAPPHVETKTIEPAPATSFSVFLDGKTTPAVEASGEVLTVVTEEPATVELEIEPLLTGRQCSLYEKWLTKKQYDLDDGRAAVSFASVGPVGSYKWAKYAPMKTKGRFPIDKGQLLIGEPVMRIPEPAVVDPHLDREETIGFSKDGHVNSYTRVQYHARPQDPESLLDEYVSRPILSPEVLHDSNNTPDRNRNLFPNAVYQEEAPGPEARIGTYDLPLQSKVHIKINGERRKTIQTRLLPLITTPERVRTELNLDGGRPDDDWLRRIWRASMIALNLWGCSLPRNGYPTPSMTEFVLMYLSHGPQRQDGAQGMQTATLGPQTTKVQSDRRASRRLANLADRLKNCETEAPFDLEDDVPSRTVGLSEGADFNHYAPVSRRRLMKELLPIYSPYRHDPVTSHPHDRRGIH